MIAIFSPSIHRPFFAQQSDDEIYPRMKKDPETVVVGAGIVGICTALYLQEKGRQVTLIDRMPPGEGTSSGNAGIISVGSVHPEAMPGIWKEIPHMLLQRMAPIALRPAYAPRLLPWFARFLSSSSPAKADQSSAAISALSSRALDYLQPLVDKAGARALLRQEGTLYINETPSQFAAARLNCSYYQRRDVDYQLIDGSELADLEPNLRSGLAGAVLVPAGAQTLSPLALSRSLFRLFQQQGGEFLAAEVRGFKLEGKRVTALYTDRDMPSNQELSNQVPCREVFITAGAYSKTLAKQLGSSVPLDTERGYSVDLPSPGIELKRPLLFAGRAFAATSMTDGLRLAGTVEFAGLKAAPNYQRAHNLARQAAYLFPRLNAPEGQNEGIPWMGFRPSVPDTVPVISASPHFDNAFF
ncbi:FAD-dependent oxidoreductase, partial [Porticoccaceae bacterium]|nr:FAD-dependent oxidoreductase [Porticoccaceae bacterium]